MVTFEAAKENKMGLGFFFLLIKVGKHLTYKRERKTKTKIIWVSLPSSGEWRSYKAHPKEYTTRRLMTVFCKRFYSFQSSQHFFSLNSQITLWGFIILTLKTRKQIINREQDAIPRVKHWELGNLRLRENFYH